MRKLAGRYRNPLQRFIAFVGPLVELRFEASGSRLFPATGPCRLFAARFHGCAGCAHLASAINAIDVTRPLLMRPSHDRLRHGAKYITYLADV
jgi:hypothetical protein